LQGWQNVVEQNTAEGEARTVFCGTQMPEQGILQLPFVMRRLPIVFIIHYSFCPQDQPLFAMDGKQRGIYIYLNLF